MTDDTTDEAEAEDAISFEEMMAFAVGPCRAEVS